MMEADRYSGNGWLEVVKNGRGGQRKREHKRLEEGGIQAGGGRHPGRGREASRPGDGRGTKCC